MGKFGPTEILLILAIVVLFFPSFPNSKRQQKFDLFGMLIMAITLVCFSLSMTFVQTEGFSSKITLTWLAFAAIGFMSFLVVEYSVSEPMLDLKIFQDLQLSLGLLLSVIVYSFIAGIMFIIPFFLQFVKQYSSFEIGCLLSTSPILGGLISPISGILCDHFKSSTIRLIGLLFIAGGCLAISTFNEDLTILGYILRIAPYGLGTGIFISSNISAVMGAMTQERLGITSSLLSLSRNLGQTIGLLTMGTLFSSLTLRQSNFSMQIDLTTAPIESLIIGVQTTFHWAAILLIIAVILGAFSCWKASLNQG
jgi:hypothetical protein